MNVSSPSSAAIRQFLTDRFGLFLHWGLYAIPGGRWHGQTTDNLSEWLQARFRIPNREYHALAAQFRPDHFDADRWVTMAQEAGMRYIVFTAKHHEGFAMYDSHVSDFTITRATPWRRDPLAELADACRRHGMRLGLYYSQFLDWAEPDGGNPGNSIPKNYGMSWGNDWDFPDAKPEQYENCLQRKILPQIRELLTQYGPVATLWFDCPAGITGDQSRRIGELVHSLQPDCLINGRLGHGIGDYATLGDNQSACGQSDSPTEALATTNNSWGFKLDDHNWKSPEELIDALLSAAEHNANYLLNIGPDAMGDFPESAVAILRKIGQWHSRHGHVLHGSAGTPFGRSLPQAYALSNGKKLHLFLKKTGRTEETVNGLLSTCTAATRPFKQVLAECAMPSLTLDTSSFAADDRFPCVTLTFDEAPLRLVPGRIPQDDSLELLAAETSPGYASLRTSYQTGSLDVDGRMMLVSDEPSLDPDGTLANWQSPQTVLHWSLRLPRGHWQVAIETRSRMHGLAWQGGLTVEAAFNGQTLLKALDADRITADKYYASAESDLGAFDIAEDTDGDFALRTVAPGPEAAGMMNFVKLMIRKTSA